MSNVKFFGIVALVMVAAAIIGTTIPLVKDAEWFDLANSQVVRYLGHAVILIIVLSMVDRVSGLWTKLGIAAVYFLGYAIPHVWFGTTAHLPYMDVLPAAIIIVHLVWVAPRET